MVSKKTKKSKSANMDQLPINSLSMRTQCVADVIPTYQPQSVIYLMSRDQRVQDNHALHAAQKRACELKLSLRVIFLLYASSHKRAREHFEFMLAGLDEVAHNLAKQNISFQLMIQTKDRSEEVVELMRIHKPAALFIDFSPLKSARTFLANISRTAIAPVYEVDAHNIVPVWVASSKQEFGAYTLRPKLHKLLAQWLVEQPQVVNHPYGTAEVVWPQKLIDTVLGGLRKNGTKNSAIPGEAAAHNALQDFIHNKLSHYAVNRNIATLDSQSNLSPYLHFGQLSSLRVALSLQNVLLEHNQQLHMLESPKIPSDDSPTFKAGADAVLEEMIVRKELSDNFCYYNQNYDNILSAPQWALKSLDAHRQDPRDFVYSFEQFEQAATHDELWNAAQKELTTTGKMHGYMRMYWAKKVLEWTETPEQAVDFLIRLNDFYSIDGADPNGYAGIMWSVAGLHDRSWFERPVFGAVRYMNETGAKKRFNLQEYIDKYK